MRFKRVIQAAAVAVSALLAVSCSSAGTSEGGAVQENKVLQIGATAEPAGLDMIAVDGAGTPFVLLFNVYETLVRLDEHRTPKPLLATDWQISDDRLTYTFNLDSAAKFSDGTPVNAQAVVHSFQRILDGDAKKQVLGNFAPLKAVRAKGDYTVELQLKQPSNQFLLTLADAGGIIVNPAVDKDSLNEKPAGSGPYLFDAWEPGEYVRLKLNPNYWGTNPHFQEVNFRYYADPNAMNTAMLSGQLDIISNLTVPQAVGQFSDGSKYTVLEGVTDGEVLLSYNHRNEALAKREVRQALNFAVDRKLVMESAWAGKGELIGSMVPPNAPWYEDLNGVYPHDPTKARELLAAAGYESGLTLRLRVPTLPYAPPAARSIQSQLSEVGVKVEIEELEFSRWLDLVYSQHDYDMTIVAHVEPYDLKMYSRAENYMGYVKPEFDELVKSADAGSAEEFVTKQRAAARVLTEDAASNWLFLLPNIIITQSDIVGVTKDQTSLAFDVTKIASAR
ncbi:ABC transporter substrate-binding protein [Tessaracoccus sp. OH4464_COT-324]|uniref:ABC transporter substrate-binding protein n=1 Tax=Tessaracoccus sp. OH4464_COT-324 TaxID=2491059 RepID=UPI000F62C57E|nr:ABC transporter substrate-binding protein [Tessaracoccus sp. OH4464_COT-324]RRD47444.1 ABC transporter substrate-binding protein [Tessaracoccus sp. OH4464_COT-324]